MNTTTKLPLVLENLALVHGIMCVTQNEQDIGGRQHDHLQGPVPSERSLLCLVGRLQEIPGLRTLGTEQVGSGGGVVVTVRAHIHQDVLAGQVYCHDRTPNNIELGILLQSRYRYSDPLGHIVIIVVPESDELRFQDQGLLETDIAEKPYRLTSLDMELRYLDPLLLLDARPVLLGVI